MFPSLVWHKSFVFLLTNFVVASALCSLRKGAVIHLQKYEVTSLSMAAILVAAPIS